MRLEVSTEGAVMTDYQYKTILKRIKMIIAGCKDLKEAENKIDELIGEKDINDKKYE